MTTQTYLFPAGFPVLVETLDQSIDGFLTDPLEDLEDIIKITTDDGEVIRLKGWMFSSDREWYDNTKFPGEDGWIGRGGVLLHHPPNVAAGEVVG